MYSLPYLLEVLNSSASSPLIVLKHSIGVWLFEKNDYNEFARVRNSIGFKVDIWQLCILSRNEVKEIVSGVHNPYVHKKLIKKAHIKRL